MMKLHIPLMMTILLLAGNRVWDYTKYTDGKVYDVVIYGGGSAGFIAAIQTAKLKRSVALIEPSGVIGGMNVEGLGGTDIDNHKEFQNSLAVSGLALEFYTRIAAKYGRLDAFKKALSNKEMNTNLWRFEPHVAREVINSWLAEYKIDVFKNERLKLAKDAVLMDKKQIKQVEMETGKLFKGKVFIDASIEGDLLNLAGISNIIGREANATYGETLNGIRDKTTHAQFQVNVDPFIEPGNPRSGLIQGMQDEPFGTPGESDKRIQAYCYRVCLTKNSSNKIAFRQPGNYDRNAYEIYVRYLMAGGKLYTPRANIPNEKTDLGAWHDLSHNLYGMNHQYPAGNYQKRENILQYHASFTQGLFYFLSTDTAVLRLAPALQKEWSLWGLAKDEFTDNAGWPRNFYVRDARRMVADYVITENHAKKEGAINVEDPVAVAYWPMDVHGVRRIVKNGRAYNEGFVFGGNWWKPFGISYRSLVPKKNECTNLLTPTCLSASHIAFGAVRIEWTFMALGQVTALAAVLALDNKTTVQDVDYSKLIEQLSREGIITEIKPSPVK